MATVVDLARVLAASVLLASLSACGQKGPLYLPDKGGEVVTRPAGQTAQPPPPSQQPAPQPSTQPRPDDDDVERKNEPPR